MHYDDICSHIGAKIPRIASLPRDDRTFLSRVKTVYIPLVHLPGAYAPGFVLRTEMLLRERPVSPGSQGSRG